MKTFIAIMGWGVAVIVACIAYAMIHYETAWRDSEIAKIRKEKEEIQMKLTAARDEANRKLAKIGSLTDQLKSAYDISIASKDAEIEAEKRLVSALKGKIAGMEVLSATTTAPIMTQRPTIDRPLTVSSPQRVVGTTATTHTEAEPNPFWSTMNGIRIAKVIKQEAELHWKTDFTMVAWQIKEQKEAYEKLLDYKKSYNSTMKVIISEAEQHWGTDYSMVVWQIKEQVEAKNSLDRR